MHNQQVQEQVRDQVQQLALDQIWIQGRRQERDLAWSQLSRQLWELTCDHVFDLVWVQVQAAIRAPVRHQSQEETSNGHRTAGSG